VNEWRPALKALVNGSWNEWQHPMPTHAEWSEKAKRELAQAEDPDEQAHL
jgi:hypothetical protein